MSTPDMSGIPSGTPPHEGLFSTVPSADERTLAMLAELLQLFSWFIGPLILYFVKRESPFVRFHAMQAILWQIVMVILYIVGFAFFIPILILTKNKTGAAHDAFPLIFFLCFYLLLGLIWVGNFVIGIYFAVKANSGAWASYPVLGHLARKIAGV